MRFKSCGVIDQHSVLVASGDGEHLERSVNGRCVIIARHDTERGGCKHLCIKGSSILTPFSD
eukprot:766973-Hanusia_phi.AAC.1